MRKMNMTFSIPEDVACLLHTNVEKRGLSLFVTQAIRDALQQEQKELKAAYLAANKDPDRKAVLDDWKVLDHQDWDA